MTLTLMEGAIDALYNYINSNIAAKLVSINARYTDTLTAPEKYYKGELPAATPEKISLCLRGSSFQPKLQRAATLDVLYNVDLILFIGESNVERRFLMLSRYTVALVEMLRSAQTTSYIIRLGGPVRLTESIEAPPFLQGMIIPVIMETAETY